MKEGGSEQQRAPWKRVKAEYCEFTYQDVTVTCKCPRWHGFGKTRQEIQTSQLSAWLIALY